MRVGHTYNRRRNQKHRREQQYSHSSI